MDLRKNRGIVIPLVIFAIIAVAGFVMTISTMGQGVKKQILHTNNNQLSFLIAYSALSNVCARIHTSSWSGRPFASAPLVENKIPMYGGRYDLTVENTKDQDFKADVYVLTHLGDFSRLFIWRIKYNDDILDIANRIEIEAFLNGDPADFPTPGSINPIAEKINKDLELRQVNQGDSDKLAKEVSDAENLDQILDKLKGRPRKPFHPNYPPSKSDEELAKKSPVNYPTVQPQPGSEKPDPSIKAGAGTNPVPSGIGEILDFSSQIDALKKLMDGIMDNVEKALENTMERWELIEEGISKGSNEVVGVSDTAKEARKAAQTGMTNLISRAKAAIGQAPSSEIEKSIETMVYSSIAKADKKLVDRQETRLERFTNGRTADALEKAETSEKVESLIEKWHEVIDSINNDTERMQGNYSSMSGFAKPAGAVNLTSTNVSRMQKTIPPVKKMIKKGEKKYNKLLEQGL